MAKKYIDAERLKEGLKELESVIHSEQLVGQSMHPYDCGQLHAINIIKELINPLQQEQPCNRAIYLDVLFSNMKRNEAIKQLEYLNKVYGEQSCDTCTNDKGCVTCKDGELWEGKEQPSEDLEAEMEKYFDGWIDDPEYGQAVLPHTYECVGVSDCKDIARHFANWQKEQMLKEAVDGEVKIDVGGHPYIEATELYDYTEFKPLAKMGDKVKIVIVKEEKK